MFGYIGLYNTLAELSKNLDKVCDIAFSMKNDFNNGICELNVCTGDISGERLPEYVMLPPSQYKIEILRLGEEDNDLKQIKKDVKKYFNIDNILLNNYDTLLDIAKLLDVEDYWLNYEILTYGIHYDNKNEQDIVFKAVEYNGDINFYLFHDGLLINILQYYDKFHNIDEIFTQINIIEFTFEMKKNEIRPFVFNRGLDESEIKGYIKRLE